MARINVEDSIFKDPKWGLCADTIGCRHKAMGAFVEALRIGQELWANPEKPYQPIPRSTWKLYNIPDVFIDAGFFTESDKGINFVDSEAAFGWLLKKRMNGALGGRPKKETEQEPSENLNETETKPIGLNSKTEGNPPHSSLLSPSSQLNSEKNISREEIFIDPEQVVQCWQKTFCKKFPDKIPKGFGVLSGLVSNGDWKTSCGFLPTMDHWEDYFNTLLSCPSTNGKGKGQFKFVADILWAAKPDQVQKYIAGRFQAPPKQTKKKPSYRAALDEQSEMESAV